MSKNVQKNVQKCPKMSKNVQNGQKMSKKCPKIMILRYLRNKTVSKNFKITPFSQSKISSSVLAKRAKRKAKRATF